MAAVCFSHRVVSDPTLGSEATDIVIKKFIKMISLRCEGKTMKAYVGVELQFHLLLISTVNGGEWSASRSSSITPGNAPHLPSKKAG